MTIEISLTDLEVKVRELAAEHPNFQYVPVGSDCQYVHRDTDGNFADGCIVGRALVGLGVPETAFFDDTGDAYAATVVVMLAHLAKNGDISIAGMEKPYGERIASRPTPTPTTPSPELANHRTIEWLLDVQHNQDNGVLWGESVSNADA